MALSLSLKAGSTPVLLAIGGMLAAPADPAADCEFAVLSVSTIELIDHFLTGVHPFFVSIMSHSKGGRRRLVMRITGRQCLPYPLLRAQGRPISGHIVNIL